MKPLIIISFLFLFSYQTATADKHYRFNANLQTAYQKVLDLRFDEANKILQSERKRDPNNLIIDFVEDYIDFYTLLTDGSSEQFKKLESNKSKRLKRFEGGDFLSPYYLYTKAEVKIHWALIRSQYGDQITAMRELRSAYKLLTANQKQFPSFMANKKSLGMLRTIFSAIPSSYARIIGVNGDAQRGYREIKTVLEYSKKRKFLFEAECRMIYAFVLLSTSDEHDRAWQIINHTSINPRTSKLAAFLQTHLAMRIGKNDKAIQLIQNQPTSNAYYDIPQMEYLLGIAKLKKLDKGAARHFQNFLSIATSDNFKKSTYLHLAYYYKIFNQTSQYNKYLNLCKTKGDEIVYEDKKAASLVEDIPQTALLKAQMLFDGGYYSEASNTLKGENKASFNDDKSLIYYHFLLARAAHQQKKYSEAITNYNKVLDIGKGEKYFFICYSALKMGELYEQKRDKTNARKYFNLCLSLKSERHEDSYHKQAKDGLKRVK